MNKYYIISVHVELFESKSYRFLIQIFKPLLFGEFDKTMTRIFFKQ